MVSGHLQIKKGYYYAVLSYYDNQNKRHVKYVSTGLPEKGNKRKAEAALARVRSEFEPPQEVGELTSDMPFAEYLLEWLDIVKVRVKATTYSSYEAMVKSTLEPYFRKKGYTLQGLEARHIQQFYSRAADRQAQFRDPLPRRDPSGAEIRHENRPCTAKCGDEGRPPKRRTITSRYFWMRRSSSAYLRWSGAVTRVWKSFFNLSNT